MFFRYRKYILLVLIILTVLYLFSLWQRVPDIDDAWSGELVFWMAKDGVVKSELMRGVTLQEEKLLVHHKLFNLNGLVFIKLFGFSLYTLKAVSLLYFLVFILLFYFYTTRWRKVFKLDDFWFAMLIMLAFPWIFKYSFLYRPEIMMMTLGFAGFILLEKYLEANGKLWQILLSGLLFGLAMAAHLNGLLLAASAGLLLLWNKKYLSAFPFGVAALLAFSIYFYDIRSMEDVNLWRHQFFDSPSLDSLTTGPAWLKPVFNLVSEHMRFFHNLKIIVFSIFMFITLIVGFQYLLKNFTNLTRFAILIFLMTGIVAMHKSRQYILLNLPYLVILITLTFQALRDEKIKVIKYGKSKPIIGILTFLLLVYLGTSTYFNVMFSIEKFNPEENRKLTEQYLGNQTETLNIVAPMVFVFNEIEHYNRIQGDLCYVELQKIDPGIYGEGFLEKAATFNIDLIMVEPYYQPKLGIDHLVVGDEIANFKVIDNTDYAIVLKRLW